MSRKYPELDDAFGEGWTPICPLCKLTPHGFRPGRVDVDGLSQPVCFRCVSGIPDPIKNFEPRIGRNNFCPCGSNRKF